jgi:hypothetical protein
VPLTNDSFSSSVIEAISDETRDCAALALVFDGAASALEPADPTNPSASSAPSSRRERLAAVRAASDVNMILLLVPPGGVVLAARRAPRSLQS